jgi:hypothetical protein
MVPSGSVTGPLPTLTGPVAVLSQQQASLLGRCGLTMHAV